MEPDCDESGRAPAIRFERPATMVNATVPSLLTACPIPLLKADGGLEELADINELVAAGYGERNTVNRAIKSLGLGIQLAGKGTTKIRRRDIPFLMQQMADDARS
jgi:hypothetical protein